MYKKIYYVLWILLALKSIVCGQAKDIDSLRKILETTKNNTLKVDLYNEITINYVFYKIDSAYHYSQKALLLAKQIQYQKGISTYYNNLGVISRAENDYEEAINNLFISLKINESIKYELGIANNYVNIGLVYAAQDRHKSALSNYEKALIVKRKVKDLLGIAFCLRDMGESYLALKDYPNAEKCFREIIDIDTRVFITFVAMKYLGIVYFEQQNYKASKLYLENSINGLTEYDPQSLPSVFIYLGKIAELENNIILANNCYQKGLELCKKFNNKQEEKNIYWQYFLMYEKQNDKSQALDYLKKHTFLKDSLNKNYISEKITRLQNNYSIKKQQEKLDLLEKQKKTDEEKGNLIVIFFIVSLCGVLITLLIVVRSNKKKKELIKILKTQKQIAEEKGEEVKQQREEIIALNDSLYQKVEERTKELQIVIENLIKRNDDLAHFSYIVSHNMRAPVATILGLLSIIEKEKIESSVNRNIMEHLEKTAQSFDVLIRDLDNIISIRTNEDKNRELIVWSYIWYEVQKSFKKELDNKKTIIKTDFSKAKTVVAYQDYLENILFNLLDNAIKYRDNDKILEIEIETYKENDKIYFVMKDNGIGINLSKVEPYKVFGLYQRMHTHVEGKGLGLYLVKTQMEAMNGTIEIKSIENTGTTVILILPDEMIL